MITLNRRFMRLLMMGAFSHVCSVPGCVGDEDVPECRILVIYVDFLGGGVSWGIGREGAATHGVRVVFTSMSCLKKNVFMLCVICFIAVVASLCVPAGMCWSGV